MPRDAAVARRHKGEATMREPEGRMIRIEVEAVYRRTLAPEFRLMLAVLEDAVITFHCGLGSASAESRRRVCEVEEWLRSRDLDSPFSFENICSVLRLDADWIRSGLLQMKRRVQAADAKPRRVRLRRRRIEGPLSVCA
jgi:hypothetical protein